MVGLFSRKAISHYVGEWEGDVGEKSGVPGQKPRHLSLQTDVIYRECPETRLELCWPPDHPPRCRLVTESRVGCVPLMVLLFTESSQVVGSLLM